MSDKATGGLKQHLADLGFVTVHGTVGENTNSDSCSVSVEYTRTGRIFVPGI
jgi:hypothetical protein